MEFILIKKMYRMKKLDDNDLDKVSGGIIDELEIHYSIPQGQPALSNGLEEQLYDIPKIGSSYSDLSN